MEPAAVNPGWRTSSYTGNGGSTCVEVGAIPQNTASTVLVRDTTERGAGRVLRVSAQAWRAFTSAVRADAPIS